VTVPPSYDEVDPFDLPSWLGEREVTWSAECGLESRHRVDGALTSAARDALPCDLLAVDDAYPAPVACDAVRVRAHQVWRYGEVLLLADGERVLLAVPGSRLQAETVLSAVGRLARAVGAADGTYGVRFVVGGDRRSTSAPG
jgi:hypothetical protein